MKNTSREYMYYFVACALIILHGALIQIEDTYWFLIPYCLLCFGLLYYKELNKIKVLEE